MRLRGKNRCGIGLLELMLSLVVIASLLLMVTRYFSLAYENARTTQAADMVSDIVNASYQWLQGETNFNGISLLELYNKGYLPAIYVQVNPSPWRTNMTVAATSDNSKIQITIEGLDPWPCQNLVDRLHASACDAYCEPIFVKGAVTYTYIGTFTKTDCT